MPADHFSWNWIILLTIKLLKTFGIIPGAVAAFGIRRFWQKQRQKRAMDGWPTAEATIQFGQVHQEGRRHWAEITYSYFVGEYRSGTYVRHFKTEDQAADFVRELKDRRIQVRYKESKPDDSVILDRDLELIGLLAPQLR